MQVIIARDWKCVITLFYDSTKKEDVLAMSKFHRVCHQHTFTHFSRNSLLLQDTELESYIAHIGGGVGCC